MRTRAQHLTFLLLGGMFGCSDPPAEPATMDAGPQTPEVGVDMGVDVRADTTSDIGPQACDLPGTYEWTSVVITSGACDLAAPEETLSLRELDGAMIMLFDDTKWEVQPPSECVLSAQNPEFSFLNNVRRTRNLSLSVAGDVITGELTDKLEGADSQGNTCDVVYQLEGRRTGPAPQGDPVGARSCGGLGCSGQRCAFGNKPECESGICLYDPTLPGSTNRIFCTAPCDTNQDCPDEYLCLLADEAYDGAQERGYCTRWRPVCGNGQVEGDEVCDDGNNTDGDACPADCGPGTGCGNGELNDGELCDQGASKEWLVCGPTCEPVLGQGAATPFGPGFRAFALGTTSSGAYLALANDSPFQSVEKPLHISRSTDGGATWSTESWAQGSTSHELGALAVRGDRATVVLIPGGSGYGGSGFFGDKISLMDSQDGGQTWSPQRMETLPQGKVEGSSEGVTTKAALTQDGALLLASAGDETKRSVALHRREPAGGWSRTGELDFGLDPDDFLRCTLTFRPARRGAREGFGVQLHVEGARVDVIGAMHCSDARGISTLVVRQITSLDHGVTFGAPVDLGDALGYTRLVAAEYDVGPGSTVTMCVLGVFEGSPGDRCAAFVEGTLAWQSPVLTVSSENFAPNYATLALGPQHWVFKRFDYQSDRYLESTRDGGQTFDRTDLPRSLISGGVTLVDGAGDAVWLYAVGSNGMKAEAYRIDLAAKSVGRPVDLWGAQPPNQGGALWLAEGERAPGEPSVFLLSIADDARDFLSISHSGD